MFSSLSDWVTGVIDALGYFGVAVLVALENLFPPIPSEVVLPFAGFVARDGDANLIGMIVAATVGSLAGALALYGLSAWIGPERLRRFLLRWGKWFRLTPADIAKAERWFDKRSTFAVLVGRTPERFSLKGSSLTAITTPRITPGLPSSILFQRPDIRQVEYQLRSIDHL